MVRKSVGTAEAALESHRGIPMEIHKTIRTESGFGEE